jgi:GxxExxY protein
MTTSQREFPADQYPHQHVTGAVITAAYAVHRAFGYGFLESVYRRALVIELRHMGFEVQQEIPYPLSHRGESVGDYLADVVAEAAVLVEVKAGRLPDPEAPAQTLNYLRASTIDVGLIVHFGPRLGIRRMVYTGERSEDEYLTTEM